MPNTHECIKAGTSYWRTFADALQAERGRPRLERLREALRSVEKRIVAEGAGPNLARLDHMRQLEKMFAEVLYAVRVPDSIHPKEFTAVIQPAIENVQAWFQKGAALLTEMEEVGIKRLRKASHNMARIANVLHVSDLRQLKRTTPEILLELATSAEEKGVTGAVDVVRDALRGLDQKHLNLLPPITDHFFTLRQIAEKSFVNRFTAKHGKPPTLEQIEEELGPTLPAYMTHLFQEDLAADALGDLVRTLGAPWVETNRTEFMELIERSLSARPPGPRAKEIRVAFTTPDGRTVVTNDKAEAFEAIFPGFKEMFPTGQERADLYSKLGAAFARSRERLEGVSRVFPTKLWVRFFEERRNAANYTLDIVDALRAYTSAVSRKAFLEPAIQQAEGIIRATGATNPVLQRHLLQYTRELAGRNTEILPLARRATASLARLAYQGTLLGNISVAFVNSLQPLLFTVPEAGFRDSIAALKLMRDKSARELVNDRIGNKLFLQATPAGEVPRTAEVFERLRRSPDIPTFLRRAKNFAVSFADVMSMVEYNNRTHAFFTGIVQEMRKRGLHGTPLSKLSEETLDAVFANGSEMIRKTQFMFFSTSQPALIRQINRLPGGTAFTMFMNFPVHATNRYASWVHDAMFGATREVRKEGWRKLGRAWFMGTLIAGPFWFAPAFRDHLMQRTQEGDEMAQAMLDVANIMEERFSLAGWTGLELATKTSAVGIVADFFGLAERFGITGGAGFASTTPVLQLINDTVKALNGDPFEKQLARGDLLGALAPFFGGKAPPNLPGFALPPSLAPVVPAGVAINRLLTAFEVLSDPERASEFGQLKLDARGRPVGVTSLSEEVRRQFGRPLEEFRAALESRLFKEEAEQLLQDRGDIRQFFIAGNVDKVLDMLVEQPQLQDALDPTLLRNERLMRTLLPEARAFRTSPTQLALRRYQLALRRAFDPNLPEETRAIDRQIVMLGAARFARGR